MLEAGGRQFEWMLASDVLFRDGLALECREHRGGQRFLVLEAFRDDTTGEITVSAYEKDLPLELIELLAKTARAELALSAAGEPSST
jgi:hypothetical protein